MPAELWLDMPCPRTIDEEPPFKHVTSSTVDRKRKQNVLVIGASLHTISITLDEIIQRDLQRASYHVDICRRFRHIGLDVNPTDEDHELKRVRRWLRLESDDNRDFPVPDVDRWDGVLVCMKPVARYGPFLEEVVKVCEEEGDEVKWNMAYVMGEDDFVGATIRGFLTGP